MHPTSDPLQSARGAAGLSRLRRAIGNLLAMLLSLSVGLLLGEIICRMAFWGSMDFDMEMWKYATQIKVPSDDPRVVHEHRLNGKALLMRVEVTTNAFGLREGERSLKKPPGTYRIIALGDSITMGWGVAQDKTYPAQLEQLLNTRSPQGPARRYEVLNLGVGNYNTVQEVMRLRNVGLQFEPDLITLGYFVNDAEPTPKPRRGFLIEHSYLFAFVTSRARFIAPTTGNYLDYYRGLYGDGQPGWLATQSALLELADLGRERRVPVMVFIIPELHDLSAGYPFLDIHERVAAAGAAAGVQVFDLFPRFKGRSPEAALWVHPLDAHHNAEAQGIVAQGMYEEIEKRARDLVPGAATGSP